MRFQKSLTAERPPADISNVYLSPVMKLWSTPVEVGFVEYEGIKLHEEEDEVVKALKTWEVRDEDSWIITFPKTGRGSKRCHFIVHIGPKTVRPPQ